MKKALVSLLALLLMVCVLCACGTKEEQKPQQSGVVTYVSQFVSDREFKEIKDKLSWEGINSVPIKTAGMDITEARQICVDFFRYAKTARWIPNSYYPIYEKGNPSTPDEQPKRNLDEGIIYGGLPYISFATGNVYRMMDYLDEASGVLNMEDAGENALLFGNQCANGSYVGWARVINSVPLVATSNLTESNGFIRLGNYTYNGGNEFTSDYGTDEICKNNGEKVMYESYALLKAGDGIVYFTSAGHVVMISQDAVVVKNSDGSINKDESYVLVIDQTPGWEEDTAESGDFYKYQRNVDAKWTFADLYKGNYLPFTFPEWTGADPIEETEVKFSHTGDTISISKLHSGKVTSNYYIFDIYAQVFDSKGNEIYKLASRTLRNHSKDLKFYSTGETIDTWGSLDKLKADETYTVKIYAQLGTGERPVVWEGTLDQNA